ncbi:MAG TPA: hypothetical protein VGG39_13345 [Polyangiaceae bacterium]
MRASLAPLAPLAPLALAAALAVGASACDGIAGVHPHVLASEAGEGGCADAGIEAGAECIPTAGDDGPSVAPED